MDSANHTLRWERLGDAEEELQKRRGWGGAAEMAAQLAVSLAQPTGAVVPTVFLQSPVAGLERPLPVFYANLRGPRRKRSRANSNSLICMRPRRFLQGVYDLFMHKRTS